MPDLPDYVKGSINLREKVISVMDARLRFNKEEKEYDDKTCIVIINIEDVTFGLIVDGVKEVASIDEADIASLPTIINNEDSGCRFIEGIGKVENDNWLFIDCRKLLNDKELLDLVLNIEGEKK